MPLHEITGMRDLTYSRWHRAAVPPDCSWIDIDCCHYCHYCRSLLSLFELVRSNDEYSLEESCRRKNAAITDRVATKLGIPAFKIAYTGKSELESAAVMKVGHPAVVSMEPAELAQFINEIHNCAFCRNSRQGRFKRMN